LISTTATRTAIITTAARAPLPKCGTRTTLLLALRCGATTPTDTTASTLIAATRGTITPVTPAFTSFWFALEIGVAVLIRGLLSPCGQKVQVQVKIGLW